MAWIRTVALDTADGVLRRLYDQALERAGKVFRILSIQSLDPSTLRASTGLYTSVMLGRGPLSRAQREMIATAVSRENSCLY